MMDNINDILIISAITLVLGTILFLFEIPVRSREDVDIRDNGEHPKQGKKLS